MQVRGFLVMAVALGALLSMRGTALADDPSCGHFDFDNWDPDIDPQPPFVFTGTHVPGETDFVSDVIDDADNNEFVHDFAVTPTGDAMWQLTYCMELENEAGKRAVYGRSKYFIIEDGTLTQAQVDDQPIFVADAGLPQASDFNFYTQQIGSSYRVRVWWNAYAADPDVAVIFSARWRRAPLSCGP